MNLARLLVFAGLVLIALGALVAILQRAHFGHLPGDVVYRGKHGTFYFPWVTCLILSVLATMLLWLFNRRP